jgi:6-phosphogluconolactonase/glucosamine-6-phosphate isomerase/deaminase
MRYLKALDTNTVTDYLSKALISHLDKGDAVLWLVPGGSAITIAVEVSKRLQGYDVSQLHVTLTDERYGEVGHPDSNWKQLTDAGFSLPGAQLHPVLTGTGRHETTVAFAEYLHARLQTTDFKIGLFGIGPDGHTAGILPNSPAAEGTGYAVDYEANFQRITMTFEAIRQLDEAVVYATGESKWPVLDALQTTLPLRDQPAQILKQVKSTIFNDYRGDTV